MKNDEKQWICGKCVRSKTNKTRDKYQHSSSTNNYLLGSLILENLTCRTQSMTIEASDGVHRYCVRVDVIGAVHACVCAASLRRVRRIFNPPLFILLVELARESFKDASWHCLLHSFFWKQHGQSWTYHREATPYPRTTADVHSLTGITRRHPEVTVHLNYLLC